MPDIPEKHLTYGGEEAGNISTTWEFLLQPPALAPCHPSPNLTCSELPATKTENDGQMKLDNDKTLEGGEQIKLCYSSLDSFHPDNNPTIAGQWWHNGCTMRWKLGQWHLGGAATGAAVNLTNLTDSLI